MAVDDVFRLIQDQPFEVVGSGVLGNDLITSGNALTVDSNTSPANGSLTLNSDGSFTYTPAPGFSGTDTFSYTISDGLGGVDTAQVTLDVVPTAATEAAISAGSRLASFDSTQGVLLNAVLGGLLGTSLSIDVLDWNGLANSDLNAGAFVDALGLQLGVGTTSEALTTDATLFDVFTAAANVAQAEGDTAAFSAFDQLAASVGGLTGTIRVGDLLQIDPNDGSLADVELNALDLVVGNVQLFNFENVLTTPAPITVSGADIGLGSVLGSVALSAQVVEPPVHVVGPVGTTFHTSSIRLKLDLDLVDLELDTTTLVDNLLGPLGDVLGGAFDLSATASVGQLSLYVEVASGTGSLALIDAVSNAVTIQGTPGVADIFLGSMSDALFFNRSEAIDPANITPGNIGNLSIQASVPFVGTTLLDVSAGIGASTAALGQAPLSDTLVYNGPFPETQTFGNSSAFITSLINTLLTNLELTIEDSLGLELDGLVNSVILPTLTPVVTDAMSPALTTVLTGLVDPALNSVGVGIGEMDVTVAPRIPVVPPQANDDFISSVGDAAVTITVLDNDAAAPPGSASIISTSAPLNGTVEVNPDGTITYTPDAGHLGTDSFTYTITGPDGGTTSATVFVEIQAENAAPVAADDAYDAEQDGTLVVDAANGVLANDADPDGDDLTAVLEDGPVNGTLTLNPDGSFEYVPNPGFVGADSFTYRADDGETLSDPVVVTITVNQAAPANSAPVAADDAYDAEQDGTLVVDAANGVLANDADPDGDDLTAVLEVGPANGTLTLNPDGSFAYTPNPGFVGSDSFSYRAFDGELLSDPISVAITVVAASGPPLVTGVERYGFHRQPTFVAIAFNAALDPTRAQDVSNYELIGPGRDGRFGTRDDIRYVIASATYDEATQRVVLAPSRLLALRSNYRVIVRDGVTGANGVALDGDGDGVPGGWAAMSFNQTALVGPSILPRQMLARQMFPRRPLPPIHGARPFAAFLARGGLNPVFRPAIEGARLVRPTPPARLPGVAPFGHMR